MSLRQKLSFCTAPDGTRIAIAPLAPVHPLVRAAHWLSHVEHDVESPVWRSWLLELSRRHTYIRYDSAVAAYRIATSRSSRSPPGRPT